MGKNIGKNISKNLRGKYNQKLLDHAKQSATDAYKTVSKRSIQKTAEATDELIGNKIADKITKFSKNSPQNNSKTVTNEKDKEIPKERCITSKERQKILIILILNNSIIMQYQKIINLLDNTPNQPTILKTIHWIKLNDDAREHM